MALDQLSAAKDALEADPESQLTDEQRAMLNSVADWDGAPLEVLHVWLVALSVCSRVARASEVVTATVDAVARQLLDIRQFPPGIARVNALLVLEELVLAGVNVDLNEVALRAVSRLSERTNELFIMAGLGPEYLAMRPQSQSLRSAAFLAFDRVDRRLALMCAEVGRMKLLSAVAAGVPQRDHVTPHARFYSRTNQTDLDRLVELFARPKRQEIRELVEYHSRRGQLSEVVTRLTLPWVRLLSTMKQAQLPSTATLIEENLWSVSLREPTVEWIASTLDEEQLLVYPYIAAEYWGFVLVVRGDIASFIVTPDHLEGVDLDDGAGGSTANYIAGGILADNCAASFSRPRGFVWADVRFVGWDLQRSEALQQVMHGFWMMVARGAKQADSDSTNETNSRPRAQPPAPQTEDGGARVVPSLIPSARLLHPEARHPNARAHALSFLGDPTCDLPGPWLEAFAWRSLLGSRAGIVMGEAATKASLLKALAGADLVVVSGHAVGSTSDSSFSISMSDGEVEHGDLLGLVQDLRSSQVMLSCCSAGSIGSGPIEEEMLGLVTSLLAVGVRQVLAPLVPVGDLSAAIVGVLFADVLAAGFDLRVAYGVVERRVLSALDAGLATLLPAEAPPADLAASCPHDPSVLAEATELSARAVLTTLLQYTVFGGDAVPRL